MILGAIYETGLDKVDSKFGFVDIKLLKKINNWGLTLSTTKEFNADSSFLSISVNNISKNGSFLFDWGNNSIVTNNKFQFSTKKDTSIELITYEVNNSKDQNLINIPDTLTIIYTSKDKEIHFKNTEGSEKYFCGGIELYLENFDDRNQIKSEFKKKLGPEFKVTTIDEQYQEIFSWLNLIYQNVYIILILMIVVAVVNMSSALLVLIVEKTKMIGILKALGIKNFSLRRIFIYHGGMLLSVGFLIGNLLAILIITIQNQFELLELPQENYYLDKVPMAYPIFSIASINLISFLFCFIAMILPSIISSKISPVKAINSEI
jgi:ABC-type lipoprotein release transport system permease subunit